MTILQSVILGLIQGITEFLPISSSGHLIIIPWLFGWSKHTLSFDVMLHWGSLFAILVYFRNDWSKLLKEGFWSLRERSLRGPMERKLIWFIIIATIPAAIFGIIFEDKAESIFRNPLLIAGALGLFGIIIYFAERLGKKKRTIQDLSIKDTILIGLAQALAIIPGVSRSGATMGEGLFLNLKRDQAARFSFLLSAPLIFGAGLVELRKILQGTCNASPIPLILGFIASFISGIISIHFLLGFLKRNSFNIFVVYRLIFALLIIGLFILRHPIKIIL
jgi:undecaprenyl-diphosphatase